MTDMTDDLEDALAWLKSSQLVRSLGGDPERVALCGHSAGGHLAAMLAVELAQRGPVEVRGQIHFTHKQQAGTSCFKHLENPASGVAPVY